MAFTQMQVLPFSQTGISPRLLFLDTTEDYATITTPGFLNSVQNVGIDIQNHDVIFCNYGSGTNFGMFVVSIDSGIFTMSVYSPNSNSFIFTRVQYVAKGGSDLNAGTSLGLPKLTIQAAINALSMTSSSIGLVVVLDAGVYTENLVLPFNIQVYAPNATIAGSTGNLITINDSGLATSATLIANSINHSGSDKSLNILGGQSKLTLMCPNIGGDINLEGTLEGQVTDFNCKVDISATGIWRVNVLNAVSYDLTVVSGGVVSGSFGSAENATNTTYGEQTFSDRLIYQIAPSTETAGRVVAASDSNTRIVYNSAEGDDYTLPQTSDVDIPLGTKIEFMQLGVGEVSFVAGSGVTIVSSEGALVNTAGTGSVAGAWKYTDTIWVLDGDIVAQA